MKAMSPKQANSPLKDQPPIKSMSSRTSPAVKAVSPTKGKTSGDTGKKTSLDCGVPVVLALSLFSAFYVTYYMALICGFLQMGFKCVIFFCVYFSNLRWASIPFKSLVVLSDGQHLVFSGLVTYCQIESYNENDNFNSVIWHTIFLFSRFEARCSESCWV